MSKSKEEIDQWVAEMKAIRDKLKADIQAAIEELGLQGGQQGDQQPEQSEQSSAPANGG